MKAVTPAIEQGARGFAASIDALPRLWEIPASALAELCAVGLILAIGAVTASIGAAHTRIYAAEKLGLDYVFSWKPHPVETITLFDEDRIRRAMRNGL